MTNQHIGIHSAWRRATDTIRFDGVSLIRRCDNSAVATLATSTLARPVQTVLVMHFIFHETSPCSVSVEHCRALWCRPYTLSNLKCVATLSCDLLLSLYMFQVIAISDINISQGSVATLVSCGGTFNANFIANFLTSQPVKEY